MNREIPSFEDNPHFQELGLVIDGKIAFHHKNLLIGKNGSGKTRFLKALEAYYQEKPPKNASVVTLYYPEMDKECTDEPVISLYDAVFTEQKLSCQDFLQMASRDCVAMIQDLYTSLSMRAVSTRKRFQTKFARLNNFLLQVVNRELCEPVEQQPISMVQHCKGVACRILPVEEAIREFSPGERILFYLGIFIFYLEQVPEKEIIILADEPELHLHPKALIALMELLTESRAIAQLWIASHSLFIMPQFPFEQIIHFDESHIRPLNRNTYKCIYDELVGLENVDVYELLKSVENWSYYQFIAECFALPESVSVAGKNDEQARKFLQHIKAIQSNRPVRVLDYGAGQYRLWECLKQMLPDAAERNRLLQYEAYEPYPSVDAPRGVRVYEDQADINACSYDAVVLMNVLHEIDPAKWQETFQLIACALKESGMLIFQEVHALTKGEQPYSQSGFLLLQDPQVRSLFPNAAIVASELSGEEKTYCWAIPRYDLLRISANDIRYAIKSLEGSCEKQLQRLDKKRIQMAQDPRKPKDQEAKLTARKYAFLSQQYINAHFAYKRICEPDKKSDADPTPSKTLFPGAERIR